MASVLSGPKLLSMNRTEEGHREYTASYIVASTTTEGPATILSTIDSVFPIGDPWSQFGGADVDSTAYRLPGTKISALVSEEGEPAKYWEAELTYSTKPPKTDRCMTSSIGDPIDEPQKISGGFVTYLKEQSRDRYGEAILNSAFELFHGPAVEFPEVSPTVKISQNVLDLELSLITGQINTLNDSSLWGMPARTILLSNVSWERKLYGTCNFYYTRNFEFEVNGYGFDRDLLDEGTKVLNGHWKDGEWVLDDINGAPPDPSNPKHFIQFKDINGENARVILDGSGKPTDGFFGTSSGSGSSTNAGSIHVEYHRESNFLLLGIPTSL